MTIGALEDLHYVIDWVGGNPAEGDEDFFTQVQILIGVKGERGADSFDLAVCSPSRLPERFDFANWSDEDQELDVLPGGNVLPIRGLWLMQHWSRSEFRAAIERLLRSCLPAPDWGTFAYRVGLFIPWEFDYRHDRELNHQAGLPEVRISFWHDEWQPPD